MKKLLVSPEVIQAYKDHAKETCIFRVDPQWNTSLPEEWYNMTEYEKWCCHVDELYAQYPDIYNPNDSDWFMHDRVTELYS